MLINNTIFKDNIVYDYTSWSGSIEMNYGNLSIYNSKFINNGGESCKTVGVLQFYHGTLIIFNTESSMIKDFNNSDNNINNSLCSRNNDI